MIELKDTKKIKHIIIRVELDKNKTKVISAFSAWENIALLLEGVGMMMAQCISEGMDRSKAIKGIQNYVMKIIDNYKVMPREKLERLKNK